MLARRVLYLYPITLNPMTRFSEVVASPALRLFAIGALAAVSAMTVACSSSPQEKEAKFLRNGQALLEKKDYSRALLQFKNAAVAMPKDAEPYYRMGVASLAAGSLPNAIQALRKATELNPKHEQAQLKLAQLMTESGKEILQQAAGRLEGVLSASPENPDASDALAFAEWKLGKTDEAVDRLQETLQKFPARLQTSVELARLKLGQKDLGAAEQILKQAVASDPQSAAAELALGQLYMLANQPAKAEPELRKAIQLDPKKGAALMGLAAIQAASNRMDEAEQTYRQAATVPGAEFKPVHALFLYRTGKRDAALAEFEKLAKQNPNDRNARSRLFAAYAAMGKTQAAQDLLAAALKKNPKDTDALYERAGLLLRDGNAADAEKDLKEVLRFKPDFAEAHMAMAEIYRTQKLAGDERQEYDQALRINPRLLSARLALAQSYTASREAKSALDVLDHTPAQQKQTLGVITERNWALLAAGETKELRSSLDQVLRVRRYPETVIQDGVLRFQQGDYSGARADAEEAIKNNPRDLRAVQILADSYAAQKQPAKAEERLKAIAAANPQSAPLENLLGQWYANGKNYPAARKAFDSAVAADPKFVPAVLALAGVDYQEKHPDAARQRLLGLVAADPKNTQALLMLGTIASEMGDQEEAMKRYRAALAVDGNNLVALNNLAYTLASTDTDGALKYAQQAAELAPDNATVQDTLGWVYYRKQIYSTAVTYLKTAVAKEPTPRREFHLAMSYLKAGNQDLGQKTLQLALQQDPKLPVTEKGW
jgi:tetratricopeptide (TPR) repeat protein